MPPPSKPYYDCILAYSTSCYALLSIIVTPNLFQSLSILFVLLDPEKSSG